MKQGNDISVFILAGGKSSRMGQDKGLMKLNNIPMFCYVERAARSISDRVFIIANDEQYKQFGCPVFRDIIPECGPMSGVHTGLTNTTTDFNLFLSCDIPLINQHVLELLSNKMTPELDAVIPIINNKKQPLCAIYHKRIQNQLEQNLKTGNFKMHELLDNINVRYAEIPEYIGHSILKNLNTPQEFEQVRNELLNQNIRL